MSDAEAPTYVIADRINAIARQLGSLAPKTRGWSDHGSAGRFCRQLRGALILIANADGGASRQQRRMLQIWFPFRFLRRDITRMFAAGPLVNRRPEQVVANLRPYMRAYAAHCETYDARTDPIVAILLEAGTLICSCDDSASVSETEVLSGFISALQIEAERLEQSFNGIANGSPITE